jgi:serine/threonine-protein phosphatase 6 regulatory ankyrin repeat subunit B
MAVMDMASMRWPGEEDDASFTGEAMCAAAERGDLVGVCRHLARGVDVDFVGPACGPPLLGAATADEAAVIEALLSAGAAVDAASRAGWTALMAAAHHGRARAVRRLLAAGASAARTNDAGDSAFDLASRANHGRCVAAFERTRARCAEALGRAGPERGARARA